MIIFLDYYSWSNTFERKKEIIEWELNDDATINDLEKMVKEYFANKRHDTGGKILPDGATCILMHCTKNILEEIIGSTKLKDLVTCNADESDFTLLIDLPKKEAEIVKAILSAARNTKEISKKDARYKKSLDSRGDYTGGFAPYNLARAFNCLTEMIKCQIQGSIPLSKIIETRLEYIKEKYNLEEMYKSYPKYKVMIQNAFNVVEGIIKQQQRMAAKKERFKFLMENVPVGSNVSFCNGQLDPRPPKKRCSLM